ncbi:MAG: 50S ribosomal protein L9 [Lachnospiraceae bacterium]|nr:50S ribosomal protein L9 [Lachnospiraceae bacterium]
MEVILLEDVKSLGKKGEKVKVSDGYGRNLINKKLCLEANAKNLNDLKLKKKNEEKIAQERYDDAVKLGKSLEEKSVTVTMKVGEGGRSFGAVSSKEIAKAAESQLGLELDKKKIQLAEPVKSLGVHEVAIKLHPKVTATLRVKVVEE